MVDLAVLEQLQGVPTPVFAQAHLLVVNEARKLVALEPRPAQTKLDVALAEQRELGLPQRAIVLKSRKTGISTYVQAKIIHRAISIPHTRAVVVAQDSKTASALFYIGKRMYEKLPEAIRPALVGKSEGGGGAKFLHFGEEGGGILSGVDSRILIDTAKEVSAGRGETFSDLHLSEAAWWDSFGLKGGLIGETKANGLLNAVPDEPETMIVIESTANGFNWFHRFWQSAERGENGYAPVFISWTEDPRCQRVFMGTAKLTPEQQRERFIESIGDTSVSPWAGEEPDLIRDFDCTPEQLYWRRTAIPAKSQGKLELFRQEYPTTPSEAFIGNSRQVFSVVFTARAAKEAEERSERPWELGGPERGLFRSTAHRARELLDGTVLVPSSVEWVPEKRLTGRVEWWPGYFWEPRDPLWTLWLPKGARPGAEWSPEEWRQAHERGEIDLDTMQHGMDRALLGTGQFVIGGDPADDIENNSPTEKDEHAFNALVAVDHRTGEQVAEYEARQDHDLVARHAFLAGLFLNRAWLGIEATGGYGNSMLALLNRQLNYTFLYRHRLLTTVRGEETSKLGWYTEKQSKQLMEAGAQAMLREGTHGIRSPRLAGQLMTYVKDERGRHGPSDGSFADLLMAWMQAQEIRRLKPLRSPESGAPASSITRRVGW